METAAEREQPKGYFYTLHASPVLFVCDIEVYYLWGPCSRTSFFCAGGDHFTLHSFAVSNTFNVEGMHIMIWIFLASEASA